MMRPPHSACTPVVLDTMGVEKQIHIFEGCEGWAFVEIWSTEQLPFEARLEFSAGQVSRPPIQLSVPTGYTAICLPASSVRVLGTRITPNAAPTVQALVSSVDRPIPTANVWITEHLTVTAGYEAIVPAFGARLVQIEPDSEVTILRGLCITRLLNYNGDVIAAYNLTDIPAEGLELGDAASLEVQYAAAQRVRVVWRLRF